MPEEAFKTILLQVVAGTDKLAAEAETDGEREEKAEAEGETTDFVSMAADKSKASSGVVRPEAFKEATFLYPNISQMRLSSMLADFKRTMVVALKQ